MKQLLYRVIYTSDGIKNVMVENESNFNKAAGIFELARKKSAPVNGANVRFEVFSRCLNCYVVIESVEIPAAVKQTRYALVDTKTGLYLSKYAAIASNFKTTEWKFIAISINGCRHAIPPKYVKSASEAKVFTDIESCKKFNTLFRKATGHYIHRVAID